MVLKVFFLISCIVFLLSCPLAAEETYTFDLGEIVIGKDKGAAYENPATKEVTSRDIENKGAQTADKVLDFMPGVRVTTGLKNEPHAMIRGFDQDQILILLDGIPIASPYYGYVDLNQIPVESISKIKVIKNLSSVLYGANTMGGVINIVTKEPGKEPYFELNNGFSSHNTTQHALNYGIKSEDVSFWLSGSYRQSGGFRLSRDFQALDNEDGGFRENSFYEKSAFSLKVGLERYEQHNPTAFLNYIDNEKGIPPHVSSNNPRYWRLTEWKRWMIALADEYKIRDTFSIKGRIYYDKYDNTIKSYDDPNYTTQNNGSSWTSIYDEHAIGGSMYFYLDPDSMHSFKGAINFKEDVHEEQDDVGDPWEVYKVRTYSFGLEDDIDFNEKLSLSIGTSFDVFDQIKSFTGNTGNDIDSFNPLVTINYFLSPETLIYSFVSKRISFPTMNQLYSSTSGNPDLKEQINVNYEAGLRHDFGDMASVELSYFYNDVEDLIERASKNDPYLNISESVFEGIEAGVHVKTGEHFSSSLGYTYLDARDKNPVIFGRSEEELSYVPTHKADLSFEYLADFGLSCNLFGSYHGSRHYYDSSNAQHSLGGYLVWDTSISQKFLKNWEANIDLENIFDRNYQEEEGFPQPGRNILFSIKGTF